MIGHSPKFFILLAMVLTLNGCAAKHPQAPPLKTPQVTSQAAAFPQTSLPFKARNISAIGDVFWICGDNEGLARSTDGGATWILSHQRENGESLSDVSFVTDKIGQAVSNDGLLLETSDAGLTWTSREAGGPIRHFSFASASNGIVAISHTVLAPTMGMLDEVQGTAAINGAVKLTADGGEHWDEVTAFRSQDALRPFSDILSVAALDSLHYLVAFRQPQVAVGYAVTQDGGKTWKLVQVSNTYATRVFVHEGEYWAFGIEYINREDHGGYGAPVSLHSKDGENWIHGARGPNEFSTCTRQGCSLWDGLIENLYGPQPKFWILPANGSLQRKWAIAANHACVLDSGLTCSIISVSDEAPPRPSSARVQ